MLGGCPKYVGQSALRVQLESSAVSVLIGEGGPVLDRGPRGARRDACPSVQVPFQTVDGALLRVRLPGGLANSAMLRSVAEVAGWAPGSQVEITNRANLQIRGVRPADVNHARAVLTNSGAVRANGSGEARVNVVASPLTGIDPTEVLDVRATVAVVADLLYTAAPPGLPAKFGVIVDGGGDVHLRGRRHDLALGAVVADGSVRLEVALGDGLALERSAGPVLLVDPAAVPILVAAVMALCAHGDRGADVLAHHGYERLMQRLAQDVGNGARVVDPQTVRCHWQPSQIPVGVGAGWVSGTPVLGRMCADDLSSLADLADAHSGGEVRVTTWRNVLLPTTDTQKVQTRLQQLHMYTDGSDPVQSVVACAGSTGCSSGTADTQAHGRTLINTLRTLPEAKRPASVHLSGCAKGCASTACGTFTLIAGDTPDTYDVHTNASVQQPGPAVASGLNVLDALNYVVDHV